MKKVIVVLILAGLIQGSAFASDSKTADYERLKEYKRAQRELKAKEKADPSVKKESGFWAREASRSGFAGTGSMFSNAVSSVVPLDKPNSRKKA